MNDTSETQAPGTQDIVIQGHGFTIPARYVAGHSLTANEASAMNQLLAENVRNNAASRIKKAAEAAEVEPENLDLDKAMIGEGEEAQSLRDYIEAYAENYEFGARVARTVEPVDPIQKAAFRIAREQVNAKLKAAGRKRKDVSDEAYNGAVKTLAAQDSIQKEAKRRVDAEGKLALGELDLSSVLAESAGDDEGED